jgi:hypothetical protein
MTTPAHSSYLASPGQLTSTGTSYPLSRLGATHRYTGPESSAVREGFALLTLAWNIDTPPTPKQLEPLGDHFRPCRSIVARYCWAAVPLLRRGGTAVGLR